MQNTASIAVWKDTAADAANISDTPFAGAASTAIHKDSSDAAASTDIHKDSSDQDSTMVGIAGDSLHPATANPEMACVREE
jgi:hypothetical protein